MFPHTYLGQNIASSVSIKPAGSPSVVLMKRLRNSHQTAVWAQYFDLFVH